MLNEPESEVTTGRHELGVKPFVLYPYVWRWRRWEERFGESMAVREASICAVCELDATACAGTLGAA